MTIGQRRAWLALEEQNRRRVRAATAETASPLINATLSGSVLSFVTGGGLNDANYAVIFSPDGVSAYAAVGETDAHATSYDLAGLGTGYYKISQEDGNGDPIGFASNVVYFAG